MAQFLELLILAPCGLLITHLGCKNCTTELKKLQQNGELYEYDVSLFQICFSRICSFYLYWGFWWEEHATLNLGKCLVESAPVEELPTEQFRGFEAAVLIGQTLPDWWFHPCFSCKNMKTREHTGGDWYLTETCLIRFLAGPSQSEKHLPIQLLLPHQLFLLTLQLPCLRAKGCKTEHEYIIYMDTGKICHTPIARIS